MASKQNSETLLVRAEFYNDDGETFPVIMERTYDEHSATPVRCTFLLPDEEERPDFGRFIQKYNGWSYLKVKGQRDGYRDFWIPRFRYTGYSHEHIYFRARGIAELYVEGDLKPLEKPQGKWQCYLALPDTELITQMQDFSFEERTVKFWREEESTGITWHTPLGEAQLIRAYTYHSTNVGVNKARVETQKPTIKIRVFAFKG